jgi:hypothetical protein
MSHLLQQILIILHLVTPKPHGVPVADLTKLQAPLQGANGPFGIGYFFYGSVERGDSNGLFASWPPAGTVKVFYPADSCDSSRDRVGFFEVDYDERDDFLRRFTGFEETCSRGAVITSRKCQRRSHHSENAVRRWRIGLYYGSRLSSKRARSAVS